MSSPGTENPASGSEVVRKIPSPPPVRKPSGDLVSRRQARDFSRRSESWLSDRVADGSIKDQGFGKGTGRPARLVSLKEVLAVSAKWLNPPGSASRKKLRTKKGADLRPHTPKKARAASQFAKEELRHFGERIMVDILHASSLTISVRSDGGFDISVTPQAPTVSNFKV